MTAGGDNVLNCSGQSNPTGGVNSLYVKLFNTTNAYSCDLLGHLILPICGST
jgi:hypothetical protein